MAYFANIIYAEMQRKNELIIYYNIMNDLVIVIEKEALNIPLPDVGTLQERVDAIVLYLTNQISEKIITIEKVQQIDVADIIAALIGLTIPPQK